MKSINTPTPINVVLNLRKLIFITVIPLFKYFFEHSIIIYYLNNADTSLEYTFSTSQRLVRGVYNVRAEHS